MAIGCKTGKAFHKRPTAKEVPSKEIFLYSFTDIEVSLTRPIPLSGVCGMQGSALKRKVWRHKAHMAHVFSLLRVAEQKAVGASLMRFSYSILILISSQMNMLAMLGTGHDFPYRIDVPLVEKALHAHLLKVAAGRIRYNFTSRHGQKKEALPRDVTRLGLVMKSIVPVLITDNVCGHCR